MGQKLQAFWGELAPCEHFVQMYESDSAFMDTLADFIADGLMAGQGCVVIVTPQHQDGLETRLRAMGLDVGAAKAAENLICLDAEKALEKFMVNHWPDRSLFTALITGIMERAGRDGRKVRAFGEMVAIMWAQGHCGATVTLEHLWTELCRKLSFTLFCAYPKTGFTENVSDSIARICATHSKVLEA